MNELPFEAGRLSVVDSEGPGGSFHERVFSWHESGQPWVGSELDLDRSRALRLALTEGTARYGELALVRRRFVPDHPQFAVAAELLRDALIDRCLERTGDIPERVAVEETPSQVIHLRPRS